jgi:uncharacterized protein (DUF1810 family)
VSAWGAFSFLSFWQARDQPVSSDIYDLERFVTAQRGTYDRALAELGRGKKTSHWMWFIFPQFAGLGSSATSRFFAIRSEDEARAYLGHPLLGPRLRACTEAVNAHEGLSAEDIFGRIDAVKLRSSMTLFDHVGTDDEPFAQCLDTYFAGRRDPKTLVLLS